MYISYGAAPIFIPNNGSYRIKLFSLIKYYYFFVGIILNPNNYNDFYLDTCFGMGYMSLFLFLYQAYYVAYI